MEQTEVAKSLLLNRSCQTCQTQKGTQTEKGKEVRTCVQYLGEAVGWQWWPRCKDGTCDSWLEVPR